MPRIIDTVVYQHAENSCALWWQWHIARHQPHYSFNDIRALEQQIDANLDGLLIAGDAALAALQELLEACDEGACFSMAMLLLRKGDHAGFMRLVDDCAAQPCAAREELAVALAWIHEHMARAAMAQLLENPSAHHRQIALSACLAHQTDPENHLLKALSHDSAHVRAAAYRLAADLGNAAVLPHLSTQTPQDQEEHFEQARAFLYLGNRRHGMDLLESIALSDSSMASAATRLLLLSTEPHRARSVLRQLHTRIHRQRDVVQGLGFLGDPRAINWLIERCNHTSLARLAGESIALITGVNLAENNLELYDIPDDVDDALNDDPDDIHVKLSEDENLTWPDAERITTWWHSFSKSLAPRKRHLCGLQRSRSSLQSILVQGWQRQRTVAADLLMINQENSRYCNTTLPTERQLAFMTSTDR